MSSSPTNAFLLHAHVDRTYEVVIAHGAYLATITVLSISADFRSASVLYLPSEEIVNGWSELISKFRDVRFNSWVSVQTDTANDLSPRGGLNPPIGDADDDNASAHATPHPPFSPAIGQTRENRRVDLERGLELLRQISDNDAPRPRPSIQHRRFAFEKNSGQGKKSANSSPDSTTSLSSTSSSSSVRSRSLEPRPPKHKPAFDMVLPITRAKSQQPVADRAYKHAKRIAEYDRRLESSLSKLTQCNANQCRDPRGVWRQLVEGLWKLRDNETIEIVEAICVQAVRFLLASVVKRGVAIVVTDLNNFSSLLTQLIGLHENWSEFIPNNRIVCLLHTQLEILSSFQAISGARDSELKLAVFSVVRTFLAHGALSAIFETLLLVAKRMTETLSQQTAQSKVLVLCTIQQIFHDLKAGNIVEYAASVNEKTEDHAEEEAAAQKKKTPKNGEGIEAVRDLMWAVLEQSAEWYLKYAAVDAWTGLTLLQLSRLPNLLGDIRPLNHYLETIVLKLSKFSRAQDNWRLRECALVQMMRLHQFCNHVFANDLAHLPAIAKFKAAVDRSMNDSKEEAGVKQLLNHPRFAESSEVEEELRAILSDA